MHKTTTAPEPRRADRGAALATLLAATLALGLPALQAQAQPAEGAVIDGQQQQRQQERDKALRERMEPAADALRPQATPVAPDIPTEEFPCFPLHAIALTGPRLDHVPWLRDAAGVAWESRPCLGARGIEAVMARLQQALLERGYVTSRTMAVPQNLQDGVLSIAFLPGVLRDVRFSPDSTGHTSLATALPAARGELLQLRDVEQGLENLQRVPNASADIRIAPAEGDGAGPGQSDLVVSYRAAPPLRTNLTLDNGGTRATGRTQATATVSWDNPLGLNDLLYVSAGSSVGNGGGRGTRNGAAHYSVPMGYWLAALTGSRNKYHQSVAGAYQSYIYSGTSSTVDFTLSRVIHRDASSRTVAGVRFFHRTSSNAIDDTEIEVQRRRTAGYELSLSRRGYLGQAVLDAGLAFKRGTGAFGALRAPEEPWGEGTSRMRLFTVDVALAGTLEMAGQRLRYSSAWHGQWNRTPLTPQDRIGIGGRYTVRGFDGESTLLAERGWYWRNDLGLPMGAAAEAFVGLDGGHVDGPSARFLAGRSLAGAAVGVRGAWRALSYEVSLSTPLKKPEHLRTSRANLALNLACSF
ncbi:ShlB/FhaC/HecB family hemolysin secretion/activation protein [Comamonas faecalis]|uniref:ShlB/FhaC/HecB family hemolysin secretion/activation protein n=1 Tax=Comamonas faecalis TaxID=1387849 RepID=A0ABP7RIS6_9BURK